MHFLCEVTTPASTAGLVRRPFELVLVLDASGSMAGEKLEAVKRASVSLISRLSPLDRVSLVTFAEDVRVHGHSAAPHTRPCAQLIAELMALGTRGSTHLSGGWLTGVELALAATEPQRRRVVILLSDGHANAGEIQPSKLAGFATQATAQGVATTCVGVGDDYSIAQLGAISEASGSRFHHAATAEAIQAVLAGELGELESTCLDFVDLALSVPDGIVLHPLATESHRIDSGMHIFHLGALLHETTRRVTLALEVPAAWEGAEQHLHVALHGMRANDGTPVTIGESLCLRWSDESPATKQPADILLVIQQWCAWLERTAADSNELGDFAAVKQLIAQHLPHLRAYAQAQPEAERELLACFAALSRAAKPMISMERKEFFIAARKRGRGERDLR